jgi:hypothetical protein
MRQIRRFVRKNGLLALATMAASFGAGTAAAQTIWEPSQPGGTLGHFGNFAYNIGASASSMQAYDFGSSPSPTMPLFTRIDVSLPLGAQASDLREINSMGIVISDRSKGALYIVPAAKPLTVYKTISVPGLTGSSTGTMTSDANGKFTISINGGTILQFSQQTLYDGYKAIPKADAPDVTAVIPTPSGAAAPPNANNMTIGADGNVWFTETYPTDAQGNVLVTGKERIGRLGANGVITEFLVPTQYPGVGSTDTTTGTYIVTGADGNVWFTERLAGKVGRITPSGTITELKLPTTGSIYGIAAGPDGNIWIKDYTGRIHRVTPTGTITSFTIPTTSAGRDVELVSGPDGALWFLEDKAVGRITMAGAITEYPLPTPTVGGTPNYPYQLGFLENGIGVFAEYSGGNLAILGLPESTITIVPAVEYYNDDFDHYFITPIASEIAILDARTPPFQDWSRTGYSFNVYLASNPPAGSVSTCRFFNDHFAPKSSHFYAPHGFGCETTITYFPDWTLEYPALFNTMLPDATGACPPATIPVYRLYNNGMGGAPNHRFVTSLPERQNMLNAGYVAEGNGIGVGMCVPP